MDRILRTGFGTTTVHRRPQGARCSVLAVLLLMLALAAACEPLPATPTAPDGQLPETAAQETPPEDPPTSEPAPMADPIRLELNTYADAWVRFRNPRQDGRPRLAAEGHDEFPFRFAVHDAPVRGTDGPPPPAVPDTLGPDQPDGVCDAEALAGISTDLLCRPGTTAMPQGHVYLVLYHPDTGEALAVTTSIVNLKPPTPQPPPPDTQAPQAEAAHPPPTPATATGCGPFQPGEWVAPPQLQQAQQAGHTFHIVPPAQPGTRLHLPLPGRRRRHPPPPGPQPRPPAHPHPATTAATAPGRPTPRASGSPPTPPGRRTGTEKEPSDTTWTGPATATPNSPATATPNSPATATPNSPGDGYTKLPGDGYTKLPGDGYTKLPGDGDEPQDEPCNSPLGCDGGDGGE